MRLRSLCVLLAAFALAFVAACDSGGEAKTVAEDGDVVIVSYTGRLEDDTVFDQSTRAQFTLDDSVLPGFREGVVGIQVDSTRTFDVPPEKGFGDDPPEDSGIPPGATLTFRVTLLAVE